jgi:hypothetical protein
MRILLNSKTDPYSAKREKSCSQRGEVDPGSVKVTISMEYKVEKGKSTE